MALHAIILAAGQGSRMKSDLPKVMHTLAGKPLLIHVIESVCKLDVEQIHVVVGHKAEIVRSAIDQGISCIEQSEQLGTGHAVSQALPEIPDDATVLVLYGDVPLIDAGTLETLVSNVSDKSMSLLTVTLDNPTGYGRIVRDDRGHVASIVEQKDANVDQIQIKEINTGILAVSASSLKSWLPRLSNQNAQGEYYLTDIIEMAVADDVRVLVSNPRNEQEVQGINTRSQLASLERWYQANFADQLMAAGVTLRDPQRVDVRGELIAGKDCIIDVNVIFEGHVELGEGVVIGPNCYIKDTTIGSQTEILANCVLEKTTIGNSAIIGPFARTRPGTKLSDRTKLGNFVETKNAEVGEGSKINHLSYVGDSVLGKKVNVGAGTITCNYDGANKYKTEIGDGVFVGSNTSLVAPVEIQNNATVGAGSTVTSTVKEGQLVVARAKQRNIDGWKRPTKK